MTENGKIAAGIVTYNPEISRLASSVAGILEQVKRVYIFDNGSQNVEEIRSIGRKDGNVKLIESDRNIGLASALNRISEAAAEEGMEWILTLDHDSIAPGNMIEEFSTYIKESGIGIICPVIYDRRRPEKLPVFKNPCDFVEMCITSGSLVSLSAWERVGKYNDWLFIGLIDDEYCLRNRLMGYRILRVNSVVLDHELGNLKPSRMAGAWRWIAGKTGCTFFNKLSYKREVNPLRLYYATRNIIYLNHKYKNETELYKRNYIYNGIAGVLRGKAKAKLIYCFIKGMIDGKRYIRSLQQ